LDVPAIVAFLAKEQHATVELVVCADFFLSSSDRSRLAPLVAWVSLLEVLDPPLFGAAHENTLLSLAPPTLESLSLHGCADIDRGTWQDFHGYSGSRVLRSLIANYKLVELRLLGCFGSRYTSSAHGGSLQVSSFTPAIAVALLEQRTLRLLDLSGNVGFVSVEILGSATLNVTPRSQLESLRLDVRSYDDLLTDPRSYTRMFDAAFAWKGLPHLKAVYLGVCRGEYSRDFLPFLRIPGRGDQMVALNALLRCDLRTLA
jgi:hypothetical protein